MIAAYLAVPAGVSDRLGDVDPDEIEVYVGDLLEGGAPSVDIDKFWDGLHFLLTGRVATDPIEDDPLSEAVVGVYEFDSDDAMVGVTPVADLDRIIAALEAVDVDALLRDADWAAFTAADVYPNVWTPSIADALGQALTDVLNIHRFCRADGLDLMVSIG